MKREVLDDETMLLPEMREQVDSPQEDAPQTMPELPSGEVGRSLPMVQSGYVYFAQTRDSGLIKVGFSTNINNRITEFRTFLDLDIELIGCFPGSEKTEEWVHRKFSDHRVPSTLSSHMGHEWYISAPEVMEFINALGLLRSQPHAKMVKRRPSKGVMMPVIRRTLTAMDAKKRIWVATNINVLSEIAKECDVSRQMAHLVLYNKRKSSNGAVERALKRRQAPGIA